MNSNSDVKDVEQDPYLDIIMNHDATLEPIGPVAVGEESSAIRDGRVTVQETEFVEFNKLFRKDNVRTSQSLNLPKMVQSLKTRGFKPNHPLVVSEKSDGTLLVLCGNRRTEALELIKEDDSEIFATILPDGKVPCIVNRGLTEEQEILIRLDHSSDEDREPLDEWGEFLSVLQLMRAGYTGQKDIAAVLGKFNKNGDPNRSYIQQRVNLARLPKFVQEEMKLYCLNGTTATPLRWRHIPSLFSIYTEEFDVGYADGGPQFKELWESIQSPEGEPNRPKALTRTQILERAKTTGSRFARKILLYVAQHPVVTDENEPAILQWDDIEFELLEVEANL